MDVCLVISGDQARIDGEYPARVYEEKYLSAGDDRTCMGQCLSFFDGRCEG